MTQQSVQTESNIGNLPRDSLRELFDPLRKLEAVLDDLMAQEVSLKLTPLDPRLIPHAADALDALVDYMGAEWGGYVCGIYAEGVAEARRSILAGDSDDAYERLSVTTVGICWRRLYRQMTVAEYEPMLSVALWVLRFIEATGGTGDTVREDACPWAAPLWGLEGNAGHADVKAFVDDDVVRYFDHHVRASVEGAVALSSSGPTAASQCAWAELTKEIRDRLDHAREPGEVARLLLVLWAAETGRIEGVTVPVIE